jgi:RHH-type proline utilization regulon transcriptional repressor/proline dehydrogenase/delta 1-pyrroline-5-carboxylate dehydrogenase
MGEALYAQLGDDHPDIACRTYAPVGSHRDLLAYLVRRLLENGANSSFVALAADEAVSVAALLRRPADMIGSADHAAHPNIPLPRDLYRLQRENSRGLEFGERAALNRLFADVAAETLAAAGSVTDATSVEANAAISAARDGFRVWSRTPATTRAAILEKAAELLEQSAAHFIALLQREGGKTLDDALSEVREATDFCRYYAAEGRAQFGKARAMPGPTGESNLLALRGCGVFVAISPWNFQMGIFLGQVTWR